MKNNYFTRYSIVEFADKSYRIKKVNSMVFKEWMNVVLELKYSQNVTDSVPFSKSYMWGNDDSGASILSYNSDGVLKIRTGVATFSSYEEALSVLKQEEYSRIPIREIPLANMREGIPDDVTTEKLLNID